MTEVHKPSGGLTATEEFAIIVIRESILLAQREALSQFHLVAEQLTHHDCVLVNASFESTHVLGLHCYKIKGLVRGTPDQLKGIGH